VFAEALIVAGSDHLDAIEEQAADGEVASVIVEPDSRQTAPAIALAANVLDLEAIMLVCPSDHFIADTAAFLDAAQKAAVLAADDWLVSLAVIADRPETGYGYLRRGEAILTGFRVDQFVEKPERDMAEEYISDSAYFWNSGIFAFRAGAFLNELSVHRSAMADAIRRSIDNASETGSHLNPDPDSFCSIDGESIDYAIMEPTSRAAMVTVSMGWSDMGNWASLRRALPSDTNGNHVIGEAELIECENVLAISNGQRISVVGMKETCIIVDGDNVLVVSQDGAANVGKLHGAFK